MRRIPLTETQRGLLAAIGAQIKSLQDQHAGAMRMILAQADARDGSWSLSQDGTALECPAPPEPPQPPPAAE